MENGIKRKAYFDAKMFLKSMHNSFKIYILYELFELAYFITVKKESRCKNFFERFSSRIF